MKLPKRFNARMDALRACEHLPTDAGMSDAAVFEDRSRHGDGSFRVIGGLPNSPLVLRVAHVPRDRSAGLPLETSNPIRIPTDHVMVGKRLCLFADGISCGDALQATDDPVSHEDGQPQLLVIQRPTACWRPGR